MPIPFAVNRRWSNLIWFAANFTNLLSECRDMNNTFYSMFSIGSVAMKAIKIKTMKMDNKIVNESS